MKKQKGPKTAGGSGKRQKFDEIEIELVMDAYGVGRVRARAILREKARRAEVAIAAEAGGQEGGRRPRTRQAGASDLARAEDIFR